MNRRNLIVAGEHLAAPDSVQSDLTLDGFTVSRM